MTDLERILPLWRELETASADYVLATVVAVEGSSYRKPGACMLIAPDGRRAGTVSGGCLEAAVANRAWWLTENGPTVQRYSTVEEDGDMPYGSGCGGVIFLLLERRPTANPLLAALEQAFLQRVAIAIATVLESPQIGRRAVAGLESDSIPEAKWIIQSADAPLQDLAQSALALGESTEQHISIDGSDVRVWTNFRSPRPCLWIFGAGDDTKPLLSLAKELAWFVSVADGRSQLATRERFPLADDVTTLRIAELPGDRSARSVTAFADMRTHDAAIILTHSFEQDARILASLMKLDHPLAYIGVLGPKRRTRELLAEVVRLLDLPFESTISSDLWIERSLARLHAPMGLDLGAESAETIAFSILAEIQQCLTSATALPLREVRNTIQTLSR
jgi:xanthine/CO dehydrogenase XdhC/CoxF family maturation factor